MFHLRLCDSRLAGQVLHLCVQKNIFYNEPLFIGAGDNLSKNGLLEEQLIGIP
jgi:hypothetical protein